MRLALVLLLVSLSVHAEDWPMRGGNAARNRVMAELPKDLPSKPLWSFSLAARDPRLVLSYSQWLVYANDRARPRARRPGPDSDIFPAIYPIVDDRTVLYRDGVGTVRRRLGSGSFVGWRVPYLAANQPGKRQPELSLAGVRPPGKPKSELWYRYRGHGEGSLCLQGGVVVAVEGGAGQNRIFGYELSNGKTKWGWQDDLMARETYAAHKARAAWSRDIQRHPRPYFLGPGVAVNGNQYVLAQEAGLALWCLETAAGVCQHRTQIEKQFKWRANGCAIASDGDSIFVVTPRGHVCSVRLTGGVKWSRKVEIKGSGFAFTDPIVARDSVVVCAPGAQHVFAFHRELGTTLWRVPVTKELRHIVGIADGVVVVAGSQVVGIELASGKTRWGPHELQGKPYGRGFVSARHAHVPSIGPKGGQSMIERFDLATGKRSEPKVLDIPRPGNLLCVDGRLIVANADRVMCFASLARELARATGIEKAILLVRAARRKEAIALFQRSSPGEGAFSWLLIFARKFGDMDMVRAARGLANEKEELAQVALVAAMLGESPAPLRGKYAKTMVHYDGEVMTGSAAAQKLEKRSPR